MRTDWVTRLVPAISGVVSLIAGLFILSQPWDFNDTQFLVIGMVSLITGILFIRGRGTAWAGVVGLMLFGSYMIARGMGWLNHQYLRYGLGLGLVILGTLLLAQVVKQSFDSQSRPPSEQT